MQSSVDAPLHDVHGKVAFITGGSSGIGLGIARACASAGMKVVITYRTPAHAEAARSCLREQGAEYHTIELDVTDREAFANAANEAEEVFGAVHLLCNNAGVGVMTSICEATWDDWDYTMSVNVGGVVNGLQTFLPRMMRRAEPAHIVTTASMSGVFHGGDAGIYTTTKFAVVGMMEALRAELRSKNIGVTVFCPGLVQSKIYLSSRNRPNAESADGPGSDKRKRDSARIQSLMAAGMDPFEAGCRVLEGVRRNDMYVLTHPEYKQGVIDRCAALISSFRDDQPVPPARVLAEQRVLRHPIYLVEAERKR